MDLEKAYKESGKMMVEAVLRAGKAEGKNPAITKRDCKTFKI